MAIFIDYKINDGFHNMEEDSRLMDYAIENSLKEPILRFYGWKPSCVSLGRNQKETKINEKLCAQKGIQIVRRLTGGRALLHDKELTYSFVCPVSFLDCSDSVIASYKEISGALACGFESLGIPLAFPEQKKVNSRPEYCMSVSTGADLSYKGKKIIGSAQFRKQKYILQHGSILFDYDKELIQSVFNESILEGSIITLKEIEEGIEVKDLCSSLKLGFESYFNIKLTSF